MLPPAGILAAYFTVPHNAFVQVVVYTRNVAIDITDCSLSRDQLVINVTMYLHSDPIVNVPLEYFPNWVIKVL